MSNWTDVNRLRLIKAFQKTPILWCKSHAGYSLVEKRKEALTELTNLMNKYEDTVVFTEDDIKTQLKNLKDMYRRKVKRMQQMKAAAQKVEEPCWFYFEHLKFLDSNFERPHSADSFKSNEDSLSTKQNSDSMPEYSKAEPSSPVEYVKSEFDEGIYSDNPPSVNSRPRNSINSGPPSKRPRMENNFYLQRSDSDDELSIFGQFVGRTLRKLSASSAALAIQVKKQINDILCEADRQSKLPTSKMHHNFERQPVHPSSPMTSTPRLNGLPIPRQNIRNDDFFQLLQSLPAGSLPPIAAGHFRSQLQNDKDPQQIFFNDLLHSIREFNRLHAAKSTSWKNPLLYKTTLCDNFRQDRYCRFGARCWYAHGEHELKFVPRVNQYPSSEYIHEYLSHLGLPKSKLDEFINSAAKNAGLQADQENPLPSWMLSQPDFGKLPPPFIPRSRVAMSCTNSPVKDNFYNSSPEDAREAFQSSMANDDDFNLYTSIVGTLDRSDGASKSEFLKSFRLFGDSYPLKRDER